VGGIVVALLGLLLWRHNRPRVGPAPLSEMQVARAWLECTDCLGPYLARLDQARGARRDSVVGFLRSALRGPDRDRVFRHEQDLLKTWRADSLYRLRRGRPLSKFSREAFIARYQHGLVVTWRIRAATALGVLRGSVALAALDSALMGSPKDRADSVVRRAVERARAETGRTAIERPRIRPRGAVAFPFSH
jgi:hypothetical protein